MINTKWLELSVSRTNMHGPKDVRVTEFQLYRPQVADGKGVLFSRYLL